MTPELGLPPDPMPAQQAFLLRDLHPSRGLLYVAGHDQTSLGLTSPLPRLQVPSSCGTSTSNVPASLPLITLIAPDT